MAINLTFFIQFFLSFSLGSSYLELEKELFENDFLIYERELVDFDKFKEQKNFLKVKGKGYIKEAFFTFKDNKLISYTFVFNKKQVNKNSLYLELKKIYNEASINPKFIIWQQDNFFIILEDSTLRLTSKDALT